MPLRSPVLIYPLLPLLFSLPTHMLYLYCAFLLCGPSLVF